MEGAAVQKIAELEDRGKTIIIGEETFSRADFKPVFHVPRPSPLVGKTLTGLVDYIKADIEEFKPGFCLLHVVDHERVDMIESFRDKDAKRTTFYSAKLDEQLPDFPFDRFMTVEEFIIKTRAMFQPTDDLDTIVAIVSKVVAQDKITAADDGLSQAVQVQKGVSGALSQGTQTKGMYALRPYRTFREINQPESRFILRLKPSGEDALPQVALFDAEGGAWRYHAMQEIKKFLEAQELGIPVLA